MSVLDRRFSGPDEPGRDLRRAVIRVCGSDAAPAFIGGVRSQARN